LILSSPQLTLSIVRKEEATSSQTDIEGQVAPILEAARLEADAVLAEAREQAKCMEQQAFDEGHEQGVQQGMAAGRQEALDQMRLQMTQAAQEARRIIDLANEEYKATILEAERQIVDIAMAVARKMLVREMEENPMVILPIVKEALDKVKDQEQIVVRVSPDDFELVLHAKIDLQMMIGREHSLTITADHTLEHGSCVIDTSYGTVDARIDTQFEMLKKALQGVQP
jgi:flagellar assembly protein FliH